MPPKYVPKHRHAPEPPAVVTVPRKFLRSTVLMTGAAAATTGLVISGGVLVAPAAITSAADDPRVTVSDPTVSDPTDSGEHLDRDRVVSRAYDRRDPAKAAALSVDDGPAVTRSVELVDSDPRDIALALLGQFGFTADQFGCLDSLWVSESHWEVDADNPISSAYGIPQALTSMHDLPADYMTNPVSQIEWGLGYIRDAYGSPCSAWAFKQANGWY